MLTLSDIGELKAIERVSKMLTRSGMNISHGLVKGIGDDCAVIETSTHSPDLLLLTSDAVVEGVHFNKTITNPEMVGHKAIGRVLSDIAAMGGTPVWALINFVAPSKTVVRVFEMMYHGAITLAKQFGLSIVGGDMTSGKTIEMHVFAVGKAQKKSVVLRSGARPGDLLFVTGTLGGSRLNRKHLTFIPRVVEGNWLKKWVSAMIDISDGLTADISHIAYASKVGVRIYLSRIPMSRVLLKYSKSIALNHALCDGEDYELLFSIPCAQCHTFEQEWMKNFTLPCTCIGEITNKKEKIEYITDGVTIRKRFPKGYEHFL